MYIKGSEELIAKLKDVGVQGAKEARSEINKQTTQFKKLMQTYVPVKSGALKRSFGTYMGKPTNDTLTNIIGVRSGYLDNKSKKKPYLYAKKVEDNQHFAQKAFDDNKEQISNKILDAVNKRIMSI